MSELVADCPRCRAARTTFDVLAATAVGRRYNWQTIYEAFCVCRHCAKSTIFVLADSGISERDVIQKSGGVAAVKGSIAGFARVETYISMKDAASTTPPEHLPDEILGAFVEGATCKAVKCYNAAGTMFRLCIDLATRPLLPEADEDGLNRKVRRDLGLRLPWLFDHGHLPGGLKELSLCVKEDGNDGAHAGSLTEEDAADLLDFTSTLLERMFTEPKRLELAQQRREERRAKPQGGAQ